MKKFLLLGLTLSFLAMINVSHAIKLVPPKDGQIYFGAFPGFADEDQVMAAESGGQSKINHLDKISGKPAMWSYFSNNWISDIRYPKENIQAIINKGKVPFVRLMPMGIPKDGVDRYSVCRGKIQWDSYHLAKSSYIKNCKNLDLKSLYTTNSVEYSLYNIAHSKVIEAQLRAWADQALAHYQQTKVPLLIDFAVEMNGWWFPWGGAHQKPEEYKAAYQQIIKIFREQGVKHVTWFFHADISETPYADENGSSPFKSATFNPALYYPGDDYIDWLGFSLYGQNDKTSGAEQWKMFSEIANAASPYSKGKSQFQHLASIANKPIALLEFAVTDGHLGDSGLKKSAWFADAFNSIKTLKDAAGKKRIKAFSYWNESWENAEMTIDSSALAQKKFRALISDPSIISKPVWQ
jgi:beta-mannanase